MTASENDDHHQDELGHASPEFVLLEEALRLLLVEKDIFTPEEIQAHIEGMESRTSALGSMIVAKAWTDPAYKQRLMDDGSAAVGELGIPMGDVELVVVENTDDAHNMIVCTLCSCYPRTILGLPPDWYKSKSYRSRVVHEPRVVLKEFGTDLPADKTVRVHDSNADMRYLVLPQQPQGTEGWSEDQLAAVVTRDAMVGVALPQA